MKKKPIYIFLHIPKCAGTTISEVIIKNFDNDSFLTDYKSLGIKSLPENGGMKQAIESLTTEQKSKLKKFLAIKLFMGFTSHFLTVK